MTEVEENAVSLAEWPLIEDTDIPINGNLALSELAKQVLDAEYITIFQSEFARNLFRMDDATLGDVKEGDFDIQKSLREAMESWFTNEKDSTPIKEFQILALGITCLHSFVQVNYIG